MNDEKMKKYGFTSKIPRRVPRFCFGMCLFPEENQQPVLGGQRFSEAKCQFTLSVKQKSHILPTKINEQIAKVSPSNNNSFRTINHSTTITTHNNNKTTTTTQQHNNTTTTQQQHNNNQNNNQTTTTNTITALHQRRGTPNVTTLHWVDGSPYSLQLRRTGP